MVVTGYQQIDQWFTVDGGQLNCVMFLSWFYPYYHFLLMQQKKCTR